MRAPSERDYVDALRTRWPRVGDATRDVLQLADEAVVAWPQSSQLLRLKAALIQLGPMDSRYSLDDALACYERALKADPTCVETLEELGHFYDAVLADTSRAAVYFSQANQQRELQGMPPNNSLERSRDR